MWKWEGINRDQHSQAAVCDIPEVTFPTVKWTDDNIRSVTLPCQLLYTLRGVSIAFCPEIKLEGHTSH